MRGPPNLIFIHTKLITMRLLEQGLFCLEQRMATNLVFTSVVACFVYSVASMMMTFTNKAVYAIFNFQFPLVIQMYQHCFTVALFVLARFLGFIAFEDLKWGVVVKWYPVNLLFIFMLMSSSFALQVLSVPMVTIFKNITTTIVTIGDFLVFRQPTSREIMFALSLMVASSIVAAYNDLAFDFYGYCWMSLNCVVSAVYLLYMRKAMKETGLSDFGLVYYNNLLAIPTVLPILLLSGELPSVYNDWGTPSGGFYWTILLSGISGVLISISSFWAVKTTSPSTYSYVGALNKIPLTILGFIFFSSPMTKYGAISISIGLFAGVIFTFAKHRLVTQAAPLPQ